jgi:hypothetical protein
VFTPLRHGDHMAFFQIAATLIPILLFGGVVIDRLRPGTNVTLRQIKPYALWIPAIGAIAIVGEVTAISAIVSGDSDWWSRLLVAAVLTFGMVAIILIVWLPWIVALRKRDVKGARDMVIGTVLLLAVATAGSVRVMTAGVSSGEETERIRASLAAQNEAAAVQAVARRQAETLTVAFAKVQQQRIAAEAKGEPKAVIASFTRQEKTLARLSIAAVEEIDRLELEKANLYREMIGAPQLKELPRIESPKQKDSH